MEQFQMFPSRKEAVSQFFDRHFEGKKAVAGNEYGHIFKAGMEAGFTDAELKAYMQAHGIRIDSGNPPEFENGNIRLS